jgi:hypothetical protein
MPSCFRVRARTTFCGLAIDAIEQAGPQTGCLFFSCPTHPCAQIGKPLILFDIHQLTPPALSLVIPTDCRERHAYCMVSLRLARCLGRSPDNLRIS